MAPPLLNGFPPVIDRRARLLILGSFPSVQSLAAGQYYGNPRNAFWQLAGELYGFDADAPYERRVADLQSAGVAVWDVLRRCRRPGSADSAIDPDGLVVNDFDGLYRDHPGITRVYFNGAKAAELYGRLAPSIDGWDYRRLPSSSPANAMKSGAKLAAWREALGS